MKFIKINYLLLFLNALNCYNVSAMSAFIKNFFNKNKNVSSIPISQPKVTIDPEYEKTKQNEQQRENLEKEEKLLQSKMLLRQQRIATADIDARKNLNETQYITHYMNYCRQKKIDYSIVYETFKKFFNKKHKKVKFEFEVEGEFKEVSKKELTTTQLKFLIHKGRFSPQTCKVLSDAINRIEKYCISGRSVYKELVGNAYDKFLKKQVMKGNTIIKQDINFNGNFKANMQYYKLLYKKHFQKKALAEKQMLEFLESSGLKSVFPSLHNQYYFSESKESQELAKKALLFKKKLLEQQQLDQIKLNYIMSEKLRLKKQQPQNNLRHDQFNQNVQMIDKMNELNK